jgi:hypothetical protein
MLVLRAVLLRMLAAASVSNRDRVLNVQLDLTPDLDYLVGPGARGPLVEALESIADSGSLRELVPFDPEAGEWLRQRFVNLAHAQAQEDRARIAGAPISRARVEELKSDFTAGWREASKMRDLVTRRGNYELVGEAAADRGALSIHLLERKDMFIEDARIHMAGWGSELGRALARGEDSRVVAQIASAVPSTEPVDPASALDRIEQALDQEPRLQDPVIVLAGSLDASWALAESSSFKYAIPDAAERVSPAPYASLGGVPVYQLFADEQPLAIVADLERLGQWQQYTPEAGPAHELLEGFIRFEIESFALDDARALLVERQPDLYLVDESTGDRRTLDERIALLMQRVRILFLEQLEFEVTEPAAARVIRFSK